MRIAPKYLLLGLLAYLVMLVLTVPARQAYRWLPHTPGAGPALYGLEGTLWSAHADTAMLGARDLGGLQWRVNPLWLPLGRLRVAWTLTGPGATGQGVVQTGIAGGMHLPSVALTVPMPTLQGWFPALPVTLAGTLKAQLRDLALKDGHVQGVGGTLVWEQAAVEWTEPVPLGTLALALAPGPGDSIQGTLKDRGGPLRVQGTVSLSNNGALQFDATVVPRADASPGVVRALRMLGAPDAGGQTHIRWSGRLPTGGNGIGARL